ncbi:PEGA domain-containing protein [bacterium]|nr:PEGA domain-containing protein [bacterium]
MRKVLPFLLLAFFCISLSAQEKKTQVAVLEFQTSGGIEKSEVSALSNRFRGILVKTKSFEVIEREKMNEVLKSQDFNMSDACNTAECAVQVGQLLGVEAMIAGDIGKVGDTYTIDLRLIDVQTGKIIQTQTQDFVGKVDGLLGVMQVIANSFAGTEIKAPRTVYIQFASEPSGATVYLDDSKKGNTPIAIEVPMGKHRVKLSKQGLADYVEEIDFTQATKDKGISAKLKKAYSLSIAVNIPKADAVKEANIYVDGKLAGKNSVTLALPEGRYAIKVSTESTDVTEFTKSIYLSSDQKIEAKLDFNEAYKSKTKNGSISGGSASKPSSKKLWYIIGGVAVLGGGAAVILLGGNDKKSTIPNPPGLPTD